MGSCEKAKLSFDFLKNYSSKIIPKSSFQEPSSKISQNIFYNLASNQAKLSFSQKFGWSQPGLNKLKNRPFMNCNIGSKRFYCVDRHNVRHSKPRGPRRWFQNPRNVLIVVLVGSCPFVTIYFGNLETVPYTKRTRFVFVSKQKEKEVGESEFEEFKAAFKGQILPAMHPESVRVRLIARDVIEALQKGLRHDKVWSDVSYGLAESDLASDKDVRKALSGGEGKVEAKCCKDDTWIQQTSKKRQERGSKEQTCHLDGLKWEVLVVDKPLATAFCLPGGKIIVFTGLFKHFETDAEIATLISHEVQVGHVVARHPAERMTKRFWFSILPMSYLFFELPFSRRIELEADYIGLFLMASAGYDPRVAPKVYEKLGKISGDSTTSRDYLFTHPSGIKRAQLLTQAQVMEEALTMYREKISGHGIL